MIVYFRNLLNQKKYVENIKKQTPKALNEIKIKSHKFHSIKILNQKQIDDQKEF